MVAANRDLFFTFECAGEQPFKVTEFSLDEGLSMLFSGQIKLASHDASIKAVDMVDKEATLKVMRNGEEVRCFNGIVKAFTVGDTGRDYTFYEVQLVPSIARLSLRHNSRIFQDQNVQTIVETLLDEMGITHYGWALRKDHAVREYCVQYRETDLDFIERILAEEGVFYYFEHKDGEHTVLFADDSSVVEALDKPAIYNVLSGGVNAESTIRQFSMRSEMAFSDVVLKDYSFKAPSFDFLNEAAGQSMDYQGDVYEYFDYPGRYKKQEIGQQFTQTRINYLRRNALTGIGKSDIAGITTGYKVAMTEHSEAAFNQEWLIIHVKHHGTQPQSLEHQGGDGSTEYRNEFSVIPGKLQWKPTPNPKPHVNGPQIAIVTGPSDEEIYCDEFGRVKVRFHWDRKQTPRPSDEGHYTCWIRVSEGWAGPGFGTIALPRIGQEVIVSYLEGDPDKPIITGRTYHATNRQPYQLPDNKTITGLRTRTHKGDGYNELYFDDKTDEQLINIRAEKNMNILVQNVKKERVDFDRFTSIGNNENIAIANDRILTVDAEHNIKTTGRHMELRAADSSLEITGDFAQSIDGSLGIKVNNHIVLESAQQITLKVGGSFVVIHSGGVHIQGSTVTINSGGTPGDVVSPTSPKVLDTAAGAGKAFVFHCPLAAKAKADASGISSSEGGYEALQAFDYGDQQGGGDLLGGIAGGLGAVGSLSGNGALGNIGGLISSANNILNSVNSIKQNPLNALNAMDNVANMAGLSQVSQVTGKAAKMANAGMAVANTVAQAQNNPVALVGSLGLPNQLADVLGGGTTSTPADMDMRTPGFNPNAKS